MINMLATKPAAAQNNKNRPSEPKALFTKVRVGRERFIKTSPLQREKAWAVYTERDGLWTLCRLETWEELLAYGKTVTVL